MILIPQGKLSSLRGRSPSLRAGSWGGAWAGGKKVETAFWWGHAVDSTTSLCNNGVNFQLLDPLLIYLSEIGVWGIKSKYQNPCLRRSGFAQAGKCQMNSKWLNFQNVSFLFKLWISFELWASTFDIIINPPPFWGVILHLVFPSPPESILPDWEKWNLGSKYIFQSLPFSLLL